MKRLLLAAVLAAYGHSASAQIPVTDGGNLLAQAKSLLQDLKSYGTQLQQLSQEVQQVTWLATTAGSMIQHPNLGAAMQLMNMAGIENPLPINPYSVMSLTSGYGGMNSVSGLVGKLNGLGSLVSTSYNNDHVYSCNVNSYACQQQQQMAASNAGLKGMTSKIYTDLTTHMPVLQGLRTQLAASTDPAQRENIIAQLNAENAWTQNAQGQLQTVLALNEAQQQTTLNRENEHLSQSVAAVIAAAPK
jgi:hypothetical protein